MLIDFTSVDMSDVESIAMLIDLVYEPDYTRALDIIKFNQQYEEFLCYYLEMNGSPFIRRSTISTTTTFTKEFDVDEGWHNLFDKEIDEDDCLPLMCNIVRESSSVSYPSMTVTTIKEYDYDLEVDSNDADMIQEVGSDAEWNDPMDVETTPSNEARSTDNRDIDKNVLKLISHKSDLPDVDEVNNVIKRLEKDFPQKMKRRKRAARWAPVIMSKILKVKEGGVDESKGIDITGNWNFSSEETANNLNLQRVNERSMFYYKAILHGKSYVIIEANFRTHSFDNFEYRSHFRAGGFHILCRDSEQDSALNEVRDINRRLVKGDYFMTE